MSDTNTHDDLGGGDDRGAGHDGLAAVQPGQSIDPEIHGTEQVRERGWWTGRAGLAFPLLLAVIATYMLVGQFSMEVADDVDRPGPQFMPGILITALYVIAALLAFSLIRKPELPQMAVLTDPEEVGKVHAWYTDWPRLAWAVGGMVAFIALLLPLGWVLAAALLFWCVARSMGSTRIWFDASLALLFSSAIYLIFGVALAVDLPSGMIFGGGR
ncbi:MAG TPA: tripartite tricarboxylate transporter TctB family protein [Brevibacterium senegalense]|uniref:Tripartite tricarboxylate transporter TctB family protein n=1 Tax=Brevibacterium senegalense TaxID=1033736 RepID=A0A921MDP4_9MICO|nr:tripartite tricarboxylate transporter TctB family protein [Brevibacterium senegalense]